MVPPTKLFTSLSESLQYRTWRRLSSSRNLIPDTLYRIDFWARPGDLHFLTAMGLIYLYHAYQRTKEDTSLLPHRYSGICILDFLSIIKGFISFSFWNWTNFSRTSPSKLSRRIQRRTRYPEYQILPHPDIGAAALLIDSSSHTWCSQLLSYQPV